MYEHHKQPLVSPAVFIKRMFRNISLAILLIGVCLVIGITGYHFIGKLSWVDALHNASMILSGMGLVDPMHSNGAKIFSSCYALFSGIVFITNFGIILAPAIHRIIHRFHLETDKKG